jgi:outer membrane protein assembly factor BamB
VEFREDEAQTELIALQQANASSLSEETLSEIPSCKANEVLKLHWEHQLPAGSHRASPVLAGDQLLLSLQDTNHRGLDGVYCLHARTGEFRWHTVTDSSVRNSVAVTPKVDQGQCVAVSITGRVSAMEVTSGQILWQADLPGYPGRWIYTSAVIADDTVYVGAKAGYAAYDLETGVRRWYTTIEGNDSWSCYASPRVYGDLLIVLIQRRGLLALNRADGTIAWERKLAVEYQYPSPVVSGDLLVSGGDAKSLVVLQAQSGEVVWHKPILSARYISGLAVHRKRIYVTTPDGEAKCYDARSRQLYWQFQTGKDLLDMTPYRRGIRSILAAPAIFRGRLLVGGCDAMLYVLDAESGECQSIVSLSSPITSTPRIVQDGFCVVTYAGGVFYLSLTVSSGTNRL